MDIPKPPELEEIIENWKKGVSNEPTETLELVSLTNSAIATSGDYAQVLYSPTLSLPLLIHCLF